MDAPDLHHTRFLSGTVGDSPAKSWNDLVAAAHREAVGAGWNFDKLRQGTLSNIRQGRFSERGFKAYPDIKVSIQNVDANNAWRHAFHLAKSLGRPIRVDFEWRNKEAAAHPGVRGLIKWVASD